MQRTFAVAAAIIAMVAAAPVSAADPAPAEPRAAASMTAAGEKPKLLVNDLVAQGVEAAEAAALTDAVVAALTERGLFRVISSTDVQTILSADRQRQLLGQCGDDAETRCITDLGEAIGAPFVLTGSLSRVGTAYQLNLQALDTVKGRLIGRSTRLASELTTLALLAPYAAAEATGSPLPPPRSRVAQYSMLAGGAGLFIGGGVLGMSALTREGALNRELCPEGVDDRGDCTGTRLRPRSEYVKEDAELRVQKGVSLGLLVGGAALMGLGLWLMPPPEQGPRIALVPSASGLAVVGELP